MDQKNINKLIKKALAIEEESAKEAGALGFMARSLVQATMPHKNPGVIEAWGRKNGKFSLIMQPGYTMDKKGNLKNIGLPYGTKPRLIMAFIASEAVRTQKKEIILGNSLSEFMRELGLAPTGGRWGTIPALREQMKRLFSTTISFSCENETSEITAGFKIASRTILFWNEKSPNQTALWESEVTLTQEFYDEIIAHPVPIDLRALSALKGSSLAIDIYCWLTYRMSYLKTKTEIPWELLAAQFGSNYSEVRYFKNNFNKQLRKVLTLYDANIEQGKNGLILNPSQSHISSRTKKELIS